MDALLEIRGQQLAVVIVAIGCVFAFAVSGVALLADAWKTHNARQIAVTLIQDMLNRGMKPDEIEQILKTARLEEKRPHHDLRSRVQALRSKIVGKPTA